jgi:hypothetical protein
MITLEKKSPKVYGRIIAIRRELEFYYETIRLLQIAINHNESIQDSPYAPRVVKYSVIPRSEKRFYSTLQNVQTEVKILEKELDTLIQYGEESA